MAKKKATKVKAGDIRRASDALLALIAALRNRDVGAASTSFFKFLDEMRAAYAGAPLLAVEAGDKKLVALCPEAVDEDSGFEECALECEAFLEKMNAKKADAAGFDWMTLMPLILKLISLFAK